MLIGGSVLVVNENDPGLEIIAVRIENEVQGTYEGLGGTFASFVYCCLDKKVMPGFHDVGLIAEAELKDGGLMLVISGKHIAIDLMEFMDIALLNIGALPKAGGKAEWFIEVKLNKKED
jgi:hypothetical protein